MANVIPITLSSGELSQILSGDTIDNSVLPYNRKEKSFTSETTVVFTHNLGVKPTVQVIDDSDEVFQPNSIVHDSDNQVTITFGEACSGTIIVAGGALEQGSDFSGQNLIIPYGATDPISPSSGQLFFNTTTQTLKIYIGSSWLSIGEVQ